MWWWPRQHFDFENVVQKELSIEVSRKTRSLSGGVLLLSWCCSFVTTVISVAFAQVPAQAPVQREQVPPPERTTAVEQPKSPEAEMRYERVTVRPSEGYLAGFGGYTFGGKFDADGLGIFNGVSFGNHSLADSGVYGAKAGGFFPGELNWFGVEAEGFNTTPHLEQQGGGAGSHMRVTTIAVNAIARAQFACEMRKVGVDQVTPRLAFQYEQEFCRLQPYGGVGLGIYWADISNNTFSAHANFVPGFNALAGLRYYLTDRIAMFTEYKYNRATFNFVGVSGLGGFQGVYSVNHIVGGISYHY
jgi:opacity protein-like surface antigen